MSLAENLRAAREAKGWSRPQLATATEKTGLGAVPPDTIASIENRRLVNPSAKYVDALADALEMTAEQLTSETGSEIEELVTVYKAIIAKDDLVRTAWARKGADELGSWLTKLLEEDVVYSRNPLTSELGQREIEWWLTAVATAKKSLHATSCLQPRDWWGTPAGEAYLRENEKLARAGKPVQRIFIFRENEVEEKKAELLNQHRAAGVEVANTTEAALKKSVDIKDISAVWDIAIVDKEWMISLPTFGTPEITGRSALFKEDETVNRAMEAFNKVWAACQQSDN